MTEATQALLPVTPLPDAMAGHWETPEGRDIAVDYLAKDRASLCKGNLSDFHLANAQYLEDISVGTVTFQSAIGMQTAAKERIRWLSAQLAAANIELARHRISHPLPGDVGMRDALISRLADEIPTAFGIYSEKHCALSTAEHLIDWLRAALTPSPCPGDGMREALEKAIGWFEEYANNHTAKGTEDGRKKAVTNQLRAAELRAALTPSALSGDTGEGETSHG